jgi:nitroimidazol reductase NimA-like FMN-containing flavoprotein (pyridoxamine 5'-phosphate oxidase superfamily)
MFRDLTRKKQQLTEEECKELLKQEVRGVLAVNGDDGYPYALPINFYFDEISNKIYFHSGKIGHKIDALTRDNKVSFCIYDKGYRKDGDWALNIKSVIIFGKISIVNDWSDELMLSFSKQFTDDTDYIYSEIEKFKRSTLVLCLDIENMTGKLVNES